MAKYEYRQGERRYYRGIPIWYDLKGDFQVGYNEIYHWFIETCTTLCGCGPTKNPVNTCRIRKMYFKTLAEAKDYINDF